jgi:hypothetical protein
MVCGHGGGVGRVVSVVLYSISSNRVILLPLMQYLFAVCSYYVTVFNITAIFCNGKVLSMINCKGFSADCKAVRLLPLHYKYPEICSYESIVM